jgi:predicted TIM-barrel fold metal-dependent hydrolase
MDKTDKGSGVKLAFAVILALAALVLLAAGYVRNAGVQDILTSLPSEQEALKELGSLGAEYRAVMRGEVDPEDERFVRALIQQTAEKRGFGQALSKISESEVKKTKTFVEKKYTAEFKGVTLKNCAEFLYDMQHSSKNLIPGELHLKLQKETGKWNADLAVHASSVLE